MLSDTLIKKLKADTAFQEFMKYLAEQVEALDSVNGLEQMTNEEAGEEVRVRSKARMTLIEIMRPFVEFAEKKEPTEEQIAKAGEKYGL